MARGSRRGALSAPPPLHPAPPFSSPLPTPPQPSRRHHLKCPFCDKVFDRPSLLKRHMRTHTGNALSAQAPSASRESRETVELKSKSRSIHCGTLRVNRNNISVRFSLITVAQPNSIFYPFDPFHFLVPFCTVLQVSGLTCVLCAARGSARRLHSTPIAGYIQGRSRTSALFVESGSQPRRTCTTTE